MKKTVSIRTLVSFTLMVILIPSVLLTSAFFYFQFRESLNERILLQLSSIRNLKQVQIEKYLDRLWKEPLENPFPDSLKNGWYDISHLNSKGDLLLKKCLNYECSIIYPIEVSEILSERTGMGQSGESYLIGKDHRLRSFSRFFIDLAPTSISCQSEGAKLALQGKNGTGNFKDYRNKMVYSSYSIIQNRGLELAILTEIDSSEALEPVNRLKRTLIVVTIGITLATVFLSFFLAQIFTRPVLKMKTILDRMRKGNYQIEVVDRPIGFETARMFDSLELLIRQINSAIHFSREIGNMHLNAEYHLPDKNDALGNSLLVMKEKLIRFNEKEKERQLSVNAAIITGQENERERLAKELHDGIGPLLTYLKMKVESLNMTMEDKRTLKETINSTIDEVRNMTFNLMPSSLLDFGVDDALKSYIKNINELQKAKIYFSSNGKTHVTKYKKDISITLFRIAQECLNNGLKHADASEINLVINHLLTHVELFYSDNGKGFDLNQATLGSGLKNIQTRINVLNGKYNVYSNAEGTRIEISIPL